MIKGGFSPWSDLGDHMFIPLNITRFYAHLRSFIRFVIDSCQPGCKRCLAKSLNARNGDLGIQSSQIDEGTLAVVPVPFHESRPQILEQQNQ